MCASAPMAGWCVCVSHSLRAPGGMAQGNVQLLGSPLTSDMFSSHCAIVQDDRHWDFLTCRESLQYITECYLANASRAERSARVSTILQHLGLESCADTLISGALGGGLSGGQKRRLALGVVLVKKARLILLDEPTSGLDAAGAESIMQCLKTLATEEDLMVICTLHQPSPLIYFSLDCVLALSGGRMVFAGSTSLAADYFQSLHLPITESDNPADRILSLVHREFADPAQVDFLVTNWARHSPPWFKAQLSAQSGNTAISKRESDFTFWQNFSVLLRRHGVLVLRNPLIYSLRTGALVIILVFLAILFIAARERTQAVALDRIWMHMFQCGIAGMMGMTMVFVQGEEFAIVCQEFKNGIVSIRAYALSNFVLQLPCLVLYVLVSVSIGITGAAGSPGESFVELCSVYLAVILVFEYLAQTLAVSMPFMYGLVRAHAQPYISCHSTYPGNDPPTHT